MGDIQVIQIFRWGGSKLFDSFSYIFWSALPRIALWIGHRANPWLTVYKISSGTTAYVNENQNECSGRLSTRKRATKLNSPVLGPFWMLCSLVNSTEQHYILPLPSPLQSNGYFEPSSDYNSKSCALFIENLNSRHSDPGTCILKIMYEKIAVEHFIVH